MNSLINKEIPEQKYFYYCANCFCNHFDFEPEYKKHYKEQPLIDISKDEYNLIQISYDRKKRMDASGTDAYENNYYNFAGFIDDFYNNAIDDKQELNNLYRTYIASVESYELYTEKNYGNNPQRFYNTLRYSEHNYNNDEIFFLMNENGYRKLYPYNNELICFEKENVKYAIFFKS